MIENEHIPLTKEILRKNGYKRYPNFPYEGAKAFYKDVGDNIIFINLEEKIMTVAMGKNYLENIEYVDDYRMALKLFGFDNNIKI